jgi:hypothetical protein
MQFFFSNTADVWLLKSVKVEISDKEIVLKTLEYGSSTRGGSGYAFRLS